MRLEKHPLKDDPLPVQTGESTVKALQRWFSTFPKPQSIQSDNGSRFTAKVVQDWAKEKGIQWMFHTPYYPQANGIVERANGLLKRFLKPHESRSSPPGTPSQTILKIHVDISILHCTASRRCPGNAQTSPTALARCERLPLGCVRPRSLPLGSAREHSAPLYLARFLSALFGPVRLCSALLCSPRFRSALFGPAGLCSALLCSPRFRSALLGPARLCSAPLYSFRPRSALFGPARLCSAPLYSFRPRSALFGPARLCSAPLYSFRPRSALFGPARLSSAPLGSGRPHALHRGPGSGAPAVPGSRSVSRGSSLSGQGAGPRNRTLCELAAALSLGGTALGFAAPLLLVAVCCCCVAGAVRRHLRRRLLRLLAALVAVLAGCWLPFHLLKSLFALAAAGLLGLPCALLGLIARLHPYASCPAHRNSCLNPLLCAFLDGRFRARCRLPLGPRRSPAACPTLSGPPQRSELPPATTKL
ncbi:uncharacterized protein LOC134523010 [Chroicocephalus ridibundus]|uniref:uncharacterized protein LOC134523010 n=1 Tax=Chroicocephalus ridibundus TaxID=1192867 RepID=UPI002FDCC6B2